MQHSSDEQSIAHNLSQLRQLMTGKLSVIDFYHNGAGGNEYEDSFNIFLKYVAASLEKASKMGSTQIASQIKQRYLLYTSNIWGLVLDFKGQSGIHKKKDHLGNHNRNNVR